MWPDLLVLAAAYYVGGWMGVICAAVLIFIWRIIPESEGPPVLQLALTMQWIQVSVGVYYVAWTGHELEATTSPALDKMILIGLGCITTFAIAFRIGKRFIAARKSYPVIAPPEMTTLPTLTIAYIAGVAITGVMQEVAFRYPTYTQAILALSLARLALIYLMLRRLSRPVLRWQPILALLTFEVLIGFTGYFSSFKEPLLLAALAMLESFNPRRALHWALTASLGGLLLVMCLMWMNVRGQYRQDYDEELFAASRSERLDRMEALATDWLSRRSETASQDVDVFVDRVWAVYYPSLAVQRVPLVIDHTDGALMKAVLVHLTTPRIIFPNKPDLPSESELVRKYSGANVAGAEENTTIAFGYAAESYVDFGVPLMFLMPLVFGIAVGAAYEWFLRSIAHRDLAVAVVTSTFWINLYMFERSWAKMIGFLITMLVYVGLVAWVLDRWLLIKYSGTAPAAPPQEPAYSSES
jgi:hypothetical protein